MGNSLWRYCYAVPFNVHNFIMDQFCRSIALSGDAAIHPDISITQKFLIDSIDLGKGYIPVPHPIFASLPYIRKDPTRLTFSNGKPATYQMLSRMLLDTNFLPDCELSIQIPGENEIKKVIFPAGTSISTIFDQMMPDFIPNKENILFIRILPDGSKIYNVISRLPIGIFHYPESVWTYELLFCPDILPYSKISTSLLYKWLQVRSSDRNEKCEEIKKFMKTIECRVTNQEEMDLFLRKLSWNKIIHPRIFNIDEYRILMNKKFQIIISKGSQDTPEIDLDSINVIRKENGHFLVTFENGNYEYIFTDKSKENLLELLCYSCLYSFNSLIEYAEISAGFPSTPETDIPQILSSSKLSRIFKGFALDFIENEREVASNFDLFGYCPME